MPYSTYIVRSVAKDPRTIQLPTGDIVSSNRNNIAVLEFPNDDGGDPYTYFANGDNLTDESIGEQAYAIIQSLNTQEAGLAAITLNVVRTPEADVKKAALQEAQIAYQNTVRDAQIKALGDTDANAALAALKEAEQTLKAANTAEAAVDG